MTESENALRDIREAVQAVQAVLRPAFDAISDSFRRLDEYAAAVFGYAGAFHDLLIALTPERKRDPREYSEALLRLQEAARHRYWIYRSLRPFVEFEHREEEDQRWLVAAFLAAREVGPHSSPGWAVGEFLKRTRRHADRELRAIVLPGPVVLPPVLAVDRAEPTGDLRRFFRPLTSTEGRVLQALEETAGDRDAARELLEMNSSTFRVHLHNLRKKKISGI